MNTPDTKELESEIKPAITIANEFRIENSQEYTAAAEFLKTEIKAKQKQVTEFFKEMKSNAHRAWKSICERETDILNPLRLAEESLKIKMLDYDNEQAKRAAEEQARLQAEADEKARREREAAIKAAEKLKTPELREQRLTEAEAIEAPKIYVPAETERVKGISRRKEWTVSVTDERAFLKAAINNPIMCQFIHIDTAAIKKLCQTTGKAQVMPGIFCEQVENIAARG